MFVPSSHDSYCDLFFNCTPVDRASDSVMTRPNFKAIQFSWLGPELPSVAWSTGAQLMIFFLLQISSDGVWQSRDLQLSRSTLYILSPRLRFFI